MKSIAKKLMLLGLVSMGLLDAMDHQVAVPTVVDPHLAAATCALFTVAHRAFDRAARGIPDILRRVEDCYGDVVCEAGGAHRDAQTICRTFKVNAAPGARAVFKSFADHAVAALDALHDYLEALYDHETLAAGEALNKALYAYHETFDVVAFGEDYTVNCTDNVSIFRAIADRFRLASDSLGRASDRRSCSCF